MSLAGGAFFAGVADAAPMTSATQHASVGAQVVLTVPATPSCKKSVTADVTAAYQQALAAKQATDPTVEASAKDLRALIAQGVQNLCTFTSTATVTSQQPTNTTVPAPLLAAMAAHTKKGVHAAVSLPPTQVIDISWAICDSAPGGCGIWSATNHTVSDYDQWWAWDGEGQPNCQHYNAWYVFYQLDECDFPWWVGGLWQQHRYLLSRDRFELHFGVNVFGQLLTVGPYYHDVWINLDPNGNFREGSNNS